MTQLPTRIIVTGNAEKARVSETVDRAIPIIERHAEIAVVTLDNESPLDRYPADFALVFGGDGAILSAARRLNDNPVPICGIKLGRLGFLATLTDENLDADLSAVLRGGFTVTSAMTLDVTAHRDDGELLAARAVNDAVVSRSALSRLVPIDLLIDREQVTTYNGDGLIVSTPIGSTAHSLAAGGPIVEPTADAMILTPICPHTLSNRPLTVSPQRRIDLRMGEGSAGLALTVDGQTYQELQPGDTVTLERSDRRFRLVRAAGYSYFRILREKLGWSGHLGT
jgi:NAD+ kinase